MTTSSILLVDKRIQDHETIVAAVKADGVRCIVFDVAVIDAQGSSSSTSSFEYILGEIAALGAGSFTNIGIVQHNTGAPFHRFFAQTQGEMSTVAGVETADPTLQTWSGFAGFVSTLKNTYGVQNVDLMACALYSDPNWKYVIDTLAVQTGVAVRASTDDTGAAALGGDWFLESHTGVNLKDVYFTEAIENFRGVLFYTNKFDSRSYSTKSIAPGRAFAWGSSSSGGDSSVRTGGDLSSNIIAVYSNSGAFAALSTTGSLTTWGDIYSGGNQRITAGSWDTSVAANLTSGVIKIITNMSAMVAIKNTGSCVTWGHSSYGAVSSSVTLTNIVDIYPGSYTFAALNTSGGVVTWGDSTNGADSSAVSASLTSGVVSVNMSSSAGAALKKNGSVVTWGSSSYGGNSSSVSSSLTSGVVAVYNNGISFTALKNNGTVITWGYLVDILPSSVNLTNVVSVYTNSLSCAALKLDGSVVTWGSSSSTYGGDSTSVRTDISAGIVKVFSSSVVAALNTNGRLIVWGETANLPSGSVLTELSSGVVDVFISSGSYAALKSNGKVVTWGNVTNGGNSTSVANDISANVVTVFSNGVSFSAVRKDSKVIIWGAAGSGGTFNINDGGVLKPVVDGDLNSGIYNINNTNFALAAIQNTTATTFDLSMSYYTDNDRYDILRNRQNRRLVNLTTLNNNVFTLSSARDIERFNYTIPSGAGPFRIIIPDYVDSNYSITSTATLPGAALTSYIIACDESEPVTISGTTYINYGAFVYRRNADNSFTKMTNVTIGGLTYNAYGGDGINSSGIALRYRFGAFTVPTKTFGDASFNLTAPVTDSSGALTYTSSNTTVATVTSGGTVTIVGSGSTTITATQAASGSWPADSITATLVVNKFVSTLGALTVPAKLAGDAPFVLTTPTSTVSSIISPVSTIITTASVIVPPPEILDISYGATWTQRGQDIDGEAASDSSGYSVSFSADGTVVAIGSPSAKTPGGIAVGHVRVYKYVPTKVTAVTDQTSASFGPVGWTRMGRDIDGELLSDQSGFRVALSADGTTVAIGAPYANNLAGTNDVGHVRVYKYNPNKLTEVTDQTSASFGPVGWDRLGRDIDGEAASDNSGYSVALSADGTIVAIGAYSAENPTGIIDVGHVRVYKYTPTKVTEVTDQTSASFGPVGWTRMGRDIDGEAANDYSGHNVALSADGTTVAIGAFSANTPGATLEVGHVRVYKYEPTKVTEVTDQTSASFGPVGWTRMGRDIDGEAAGDWSGRSVALSADGTTVAIGAVNANTPAGTNDVGHVRVYKYNPNKLTEVTDQTSTSFGPAGWDRLGRDIDGEAAGDQSGWSVALSADGTIVAIGAIYANNPAGTNYVGHVRVYKYTPTKVTEVTDQTSASFGPVGWDRLGRDIDGEAAIDYSGYSVALSADGTTVAIGAIYANTPAGTENVGHVRVYQIATTNALTYSSSNSSVADVCGNLLLIKGVNGTSAITATQTGNTVTARLDVSGTTYTLYYNPITYTSSNTGVATVTTLGTVTLTGTVGTSTITATQPATRNYESRSVTGVLDVSKLSSTLGELTVPTKVPGDAPFVLTAPTSTVSSIISPVNTITSTASVIVPPPDIRDISYGTTWTQRGQDIDGEAAGDYSGTSVSFSADGRTLAIGSWYNDGTVAASDRGHVRIYDLSGNTWVQRGADIDGEAANDYSGTSVSISANGNIVAIGAYGNDGTGNNAGHVRVYGWNGSSWIQRGSDIDGETALDESGFSVALSADGNIVAIGSQYADLSGNTTDNRGHVRVYRYNALKIASQLTDQSLTTFGPAGWDRLGSDIDGAAAGDRSGLNVSISADGTILAIGGNGNDGITGNTNNTRSHVRIYAWNETSWVQRGENIDGNSGVSSSTVVTATVNSAGARNWFGVSVSSSGQYRTALDRNGNIFISSDFGVNWSPQTTPGSRNWASVSLSSTGQYQSAVVYGGNIWTSSDFGVNWTSRATALNWQTVSLSSTGQYQSAVVYGGNIWTSSDFGVNWTSRATALNWYSISLSGSGQLQRATIAIGNIWISSDFGVTWTERTVPGSSNWVSISLSSTGQYQSVVSFNTSGIRTSSDFGVTWIVRTAPDPTSWFGVSLSSTGQYQTAVASSGNIWTSSDFGVNWTQRIAGGSIRQWHSVSLSSTGQYQTAVVEGAGAGNIWTSSDFGVTWTTLASYEITDGDQTVATVSLSANGNSVAVGTPYADVGGIINRGRVRVHDWSGTAWSLRGTDIMTGEGANDYSGMSVILSADSSVVAIGGRNNDGTPVLTDRGHVRIYRWNGSEWIQHGQDIDGETAGDQSGYSVSLSADGTRVAIGAQYNDGASGIDRGHVRVYEIATTNALTYSSSNSSIADVCGNLLLIKGVNGTSTITASQTGNTVTGRLDVSGTTYTLQYNPITYTISDASLATVTTLGTVTLTGTVGTSTITATQPATRNYESRSVTGVLDVSKLTSTLGALTVPTKVPGDAPFVLTAPTSTISSIISPVNTITSTASAIIPPPDIWDISYGTTWTQRGQDIDGEATNDGSGYSVCMSADGTVIAIGAHTANNPAGTNDVGHVRVYKYTPTKVTEVTDQTSASFGPVGWTRMGRDIDGELLSDNSGRSVALSADGTTVAIGASNANNPAGGEVGHVRVYKYTPTKVTEVTDQTSASFGPVGWNRLGSDIDGEASGDQSGLKVALSADGTTVAIGAPYANNPAGTNDIGHVRVYKYNPNKLTEVTDQTSTSFGPAGWDRLGRDIDGETLGDQSGYSVALSADGSTVAIGANYANNPAGTENVGHVRVYKYNPNKVTEVTDQSNNSFGPVGWDRLGRDIDGEAVHDQSGWSVALSADGTTVAIGAFTANNPAGTNDVGHVRVYKYNPNKLTEVTDQTSASFGPVGWTRLGGDIDGESVNDYSGSSVALSADGTIVAIGAVGGNTPAGTENVGHVRVYKYEATKVTEVTDQTNASFGPVGWTRLGLDIDGEAFADQSGHNIAISADGTTVAIGAYLNDGTVAASDRGHVRVYQIATTNALTYSSNNSSVADVCGNLLLIKGVNGTSTITASQTGNTVTGRLDVSGTTYTLQYNPFTYSISDASLATVSTYGTVTLTGAVGTRTITATQPATRNYASQSVTGVLDVSKLTSTLGALTVPTKVPGDAPFVLTAPTSTISSIISPVNTITSTASAIIPPPDIWDISYGTTWTQRGQDIDGQATGDTSGFSVSMSANGRTIAIGAPENDGTSGVSTDNRGHTRVYDLSGNTWIKRGGDIIGEAAGDQSGYSVSISADGNIVAIGAVYNDGSGSDAGHVRVYMSTPSKTVAVTTQTDSSFGPIGWTRLGADIDGEASVAGDWSGWSVSLSADGTVVAIGAYQNDGSGNLITNSGHVRVYKYTPSKTVAVTNQNDISFGPIGWNRLGGDIDGEAGADYSGWSVNLSKDGTTVAIGAFLNDGTTGNSADQRGHVRVYRYNASKTTPQLTNQNLATFGPVGWERLGEDIDGEFSNDYNGRSVSLSADGSVIAIGAERHDVVSTSINDDRGYVRIFELSGNTWIKRGQDIEGEAANDNSGYSVALSADGTIVAIGAYGNDGTTGVTNDQRGHVRIYAWNGTSWVKRGQDIDGEALGDESGYNVALSSDGTMVAIGAYRNDGAASGTVGDNRGHVRVYDIATTNALTYSSSNSSVADVCGNLLLIKGVNGTSTITASQTGNTVTGRLDVSGTTYTLQYNPFTYSISDASLATVSTYGTVTLTGTAVGGSTITATQPATRNYASQSVTGVLDVSKLSSTLGELTVPTKVPGDAPFVLTAPTSTISSIISPVSTITSTASVIVSPPDIWDISYGTTWTQRGQDIDGEATNNFSGRAVSMSADGTVIAIDAYENDGTTGVSTDNRGHVRIYDLSGNTWIKRGGDIDGEAAADGSGYSVALSADGNIVAIGAIYNDGTTGSAGDNRGHVRVYRSTPGKPEVTSQTDSSFGPIGWTRLGADIDGETTGDNSGYSVSISADGTIVAIGADRNDGSGNLLADSGHVRVYKYTPSKTVAVTNQNDISFGPIGWNRLGGDIDGEAANNYSGRTVALSSDGTIVAIGAPYADLSSNTADDRGHVRVYRYNALKTSPQLTDQNLSTFGPVGWDRLGADIDGEAAGDQSGGSWSMPNISISANGNTVAIGSLKNAGPGSGTNYYGSVRVYDLSTNNTWIKRGQDIDGEAIGDESGSSVSLSADGNIVAIGAWCNDGTPVALSRGHVRIYFWNGTRWEQRGQDIDGEAGGDNSGSSVSLSANGTRVAIGAYYNDGASGVESGHVRVYDIATTNALTYSSNNSSVADVCGNLLLIKGVNGTSTITASQTGNTVTGRLDVSGTTYTLQYNPFTYSISDASLATVSTYGTVTLTGTAVGTRTITATQPATRNYASQSVTGVLDVSGIVTVLGALTIPTKMLGDASFNLTAPTSNNPSGAFTYTSSNTAVATVTSGGTVSIIGIGTTTITATQAISGIYTSASVSGSLVVNFGNTSAITILPTDGASVIPTPVSNIATTYGSTWNQLGANIVGGVAGDESGTSISVSADGTIVAIGARSNTTNRGTTRVYKYNDVSWNQIGTDINGEASSDYSGQSVSLSANGRVLAIGANMNDGSGNLLADSGHVRIYEFNGTSWVQRGGDIDGEANGDQSGISVSLSEDGSTVAIGAIMNDGSGNALSNSGHVRVYRYNASKSVPQLTDQSLSTFGPAGWDRLGADIDGEAVNDQSGFSVSISANGTVLAIGAIFNDGTSGTVDTSNNRGHVRVYRYNASKTSPQLIDQTLTTFGPVGWDRMGTDIDGEAAADQNGFSVSLSADGSTVAIGSPLFDVSGVSNSGRVRVFAWNGSSWAPRGQNINGITMNENVGDSVSLSADASILSVTSFMKVVSYNYNSSTNTWNQIGANVTGASSATSSNITNALPYSPHVYLDATNPSSYNGSTWANIGSLGGNVVMTNMGTFDAADNGGSFNFNGSTNRGEITVPSTTLTSFTYLAVVKTTGLSTYATIIEFGSDNLLFWTVSNRLAMYNPHVTSTFTLTPGVWYVLAATVTSSGTITFYVNGISVFTSSGSINRTNTVYGIGSGVGGNEFWSGKISAIAIYHNRVLTASEIANVSSTFQTYRVSLSSQGNILAVGAREYDGITGTSTNIGVTRVYRIDTSGNYTFSSNNTAIADVCGNIILPKTTGSTTIGFTQSASGATASRSGTIAFSVSAITPTIGTLSMPAKNFGDASFNLTAPTSNSGGAFTYSSSAPGVATVTSGGTVTIVGAGSTTITATQAADGNYATGSVTASLVVSAIAPTIGTLTAPAKNFGDSSFSLTAPTSNSDGAFTYESSNTAVATVTSSGGTVTIVGAGSATITATQASTTNYTTGAVTASLVVSPIAPTIGTLTAPAKNFGDASFNLTAPTSNSGGAFTFTSSAEGVATVTSGGTVTIVGAGSTTITATQAASADGNYTGGSAVTASLVVSAITPTYQSISQVTKTYSTDVSFSLTSIMSGVSNSSGTYTFSATSNAIDICGGVATILAYTPSAITITATQAESGNYSGAGSTTFTLLVNRKVPSYGAFSIPAATYEDAPFSITAYAPTTDSTGVPFTYTSSEPTVATINSDGTIVTIIGQGYTTITASQAAGGNYAANSTTTSFLVNRAAPTFLKAFTITDKTFGDASFSLLPFTEGLDNTDGTYHFTSSNAQLVSISEADGVTATIHAYTPTPITIYVAIDACGNYAASSTSGTLTVARAAPTIGALSAPAKNFGDASFNLTAPTSDSSGGAFTYTSSAPGVATVTSTEGTVTVIGAGSTTITATQAASGNYLGGSVTATLVVSPIAPTIGALSVPAKNFGDASFNLTAPTSNSPGAFTYTSSAPGVATVTSSGGTVTIVGAGTTTITATQAASADGNYTGGSSVTATLVVSAALSNFTVPSGKVYGDASFNLTDPTSIDNTVGFTFTSGDSTVATISGRTVTIVGAGSSVITASQAATDTRAQMDISATLLVARASVVITLANITKTYGDAQFRLTPTSTNTDDASGAALSFSSSNTSVASIVDTSFVSINGVGEATITIAIAATANFTDGSGSVAVTVNKGTPVLSALTVSANKTYGSAPFSVLAAPTSASAGVITYSSSDTGVATIDNSGVITLIAAGFVNFTATQAATALYNSATKTSNTMTVHRQSIFLTRTSPSLEVVNKTYGDGNFIVSATNVAESGALTYESDTPSVASVINASTGVISVVSVGTATITATRAQTAQYTSVPVSWTIHVARTTTTLTGLSNLTRNVTAAPFTVTATSASDGAVTYALQDPSSSVLTIHPTTGLVRLLSPGSAVIVASQAQGTLYEAPNSITATITVNGAGNALQGVTLTNTANYSDVNLNDAIINNANISGSNFAGAKLTGATFTGASIIGATFTNATLVSANLSGVSISRTDFTNADLSGATLTGVDASGTIFNNASLANVNLSGANVTNVNFTNTTIKGANITDVSFTPLQKLQLLKKSDNRDIAAIAISSVSGPTILAAISASSPAHTIANLDLSNLATSVAVIIPETSTTPDGPITDISLDVAAYNKFYLPINENEYFRINNIVYYSSSNVIRKYATNEIVEVITYDGKPIWLIVGSIIGLVLQTNTMNASSFVVPTSKLSTDTTPFMPTTLPTSNSDAAIVYSSSSPHLATINATTGEITITGNGNGLVTFTATQVQNATYGPGTITSNTLLIDQYLHLSLTGLNQSFNLTTLASLETLNPNADTTDATAVFYVRLSDMTDIFKYQSDSADVNDINATDLKYYVFHRKWPAELKINPSHAMLNKADSVGMLGTTGLFAADKAFVKHDFVRYLALKLFNTIHGVDLFVNETDLQENATYYGESIRHNIHEIMSGISTTSGNESMAYDASGNKYLTNSASGNTNLCRELMRQIAASVASRFYNNGADDTGMKTVPLRENDTITFKVTIQAAATQNILTGVTEIPSRSYTIKLVLKSSVTSVTNANTAVADSEMFPNSYPYSSSVTTIAPDSEAAATVYNIYSPPAPIPFSRFGFNGWYYTNSSAWVGVNSGVRNHVKWLVPANRVGSSTVGALQYVRVNLKVHNKTSLPYLMVYTQSGSWRKYIVSGGGGGGGSLVNGTIYSFYMNFNSYSREPAMIGHTNAAFAISLGTGAFADNEVITNIALETDSGAAAGAVEFTLASVMVGEIASGVPFEKEYGFLAEVPTAYP